MRELLIVLVVLCFAGILALAIYLVMSLMKRHALRQLYADGARDFRFVCELLRLYTKKDSVIKNPCLLRSYGDIPSRADALVVGGGGLLILTVIDEPGQYSTPANGNWSIWQGLDRKQIPNAFLPGKQYTSVLTSVLMKNGLSCPIVNVVVLTDDHAEVDSLYDENVLTGDRLVPYVKAFCRGRALGRGGQEKLKKAIREHHEQCQRRLSSTMVDSVSTIFGNTGELPEIEQERVTAREKVDRLLEQEELLEEAIGEQGDVDAYIAIDDAASADGTAEESDVLDALFGSAEQTPERDE